MKCCLLTDANSIAPHAPLEEPKEAHNYTTEEFDP